MRAVIRPNYDRRVEALVSIPQPTADELFDLIQDLHAQREKADQMRAAEGVPDAGVLNVWASTAFARG